MNKILSFFNLPGHIRRFILKSRINRNKEKENKGHILLRIINILIVLILLSGLVYINYLYWQNIVVASVSIALLLLSIIVYRIINYRKSNRHHTVSRLVLKDDDGRITNEWDIAENVSCLIGKKTRSNEVTIDLSSAVYSSLVSREHAVINKAGDKWFFEDIGSSNGSGIKRRGEKRKFKVEEGKPYEINSGDTLYIANTRLYIH